MSGSYKSGFTLIEILIALAIVALAATVSVPLLWKRTPEYERIQLFSRLNSFTQSAWYRAIRTQKTHKILFDFTKNSVLLEQETGKNNLDGEPLFEPIRESYITHSFSWPAYLTIKGFFVEGVDMMRLFAGSKSQEVWFFIIPNGLAQAVTISLLDTRDILHTKKPKPITLVLNPFWAQFDVKKTKQ